MIGSSPTHQIRARHEIDSFSDMKLAVKTCS